jgi:DNA-binding GntR family transcriptional regulator
MATDGGSALLGLRKTSLRQQAVAALRRAITTGELAPGSHLPEIEMSERLQIGRGTLREAMRQLQQEGLITDGPRGRLSVRHMNTEELADGFAVRGELEALAARLVAASADRAASVETLRAALAAMSAADPGDLEARIESDLDFHRTLVRISGNRTLLHAWIALEGSIRMSLLFSGIERATRNMTVARHDEIVDAITSGEPARAHDVVVDHMATAVQTLTSD